jgi:hypothetical protein
MRQSTAGPALRAGLAAAASDRGGCRREWDVRCTVSNDLGAGHLDCIWPELDTGTRLVR